MTSDPQTQVQLLKELSQLGLIDESRVAEMINLPDAESAFDDTSALPDAVDKLIQVALDGEETVIPIFMDWAGLRDRIMLYQNKFYSLEGDHEKEITILQELYNRLEELWEDIDQVEPTAPEEAGAMVADPEAGFAVQEGLNVGRLAGGEGEGSIEPNQLSQPGELMRDAGTLQGGDI